MIDFTSSFSTSGYKMLSPGLFIILKKKVCCCLVAKLCSTLLGLHRLEACQANLSMGFPRQEYWSRLHFLLQGIFLTQELNLHLLCLLHWQADFFFFTTELPVKPLNSILHA